MITASGCCSHFTTGWASLGQPQDDHLQMLATEREDLDGPFKLQSDLQSSWKEISSRECNRNNSKENQPELRIKRPEEVP